MKFLATKRFAQWATKQRVLESDLSAAAREVATGSYEANLGGHLFKKRIATGSRGKSHGVRTIVCCEKDNRLIFLYGFAKNERPNITAKELKTFKEFAKILLSLSDSEVAQAIIQGDFVEL